MTRILFATVFTLLKTFKALSQAATPTPRNDRPQAGGRLRGNPCRPLLRTSSRSRQQGPLQSPTSLAARKRSSLRSSSRRHRLWKARQQPLLFKSRRSALRSETRSRHHPLSAGSIHDWIGLSIHLAVMFLHPATIKQCRIRRRKRRHARPPARRLQTHRRLREKLSFSITRRTAPHRVRWAVLVRAEPSRKQST